MSRPSSGTASTQKNVGNHIDAWDRAVSIFTQDLGPSEKDLYMSATPKKVLQSAEEIHTRASKKDKLLHAAGVLQPFIYKLEQLGKPLDIYSGASNTVLAPLWGSIRVLIVLVGAHEKYYVLIADMLGRIGEAIPLLEEIQDQSSNENLKNAIIKVYLDILTFCDKAKRSLREMADAKGFSSYLTLTKRTIWKSFEHQFEGMHTELTADISNVTTWSTIAYQKVGHKHMKKEKIFREADILNSLCKFNHKTKHGWHCKRRHKETGTWMRDEVSWWLGEKNAPPVFWCYGIHFGVANLVLVLAGCGKSFIAYKNMFLGLANNFVFRSVIIQYFEWVASSNEGAVAYFYCDHSSQQSLEPVTVLGSLIRQLYPFFGRGGVPEDLEQEILGHIKFESNGLNDLGRLLRNIVRYLNREVYLVIDGLDECSVESRQAILDQLNGLLGCESRQLTSGRKSGGDLRIYISSREFDAIKNSMKWCRRKHVTPECIEDDIEKFVQDTVEQTFVPEVRDDREMVDEIVHYLVKNAHGMFLWVSYQLDDIKYDSSKDAVRKKLRGLPKNLNQTYDHILRQLVERYPSEKILVRRILKWIISAKRLMTIPEIAEAISINPTKDTKLRKDAIVYSDFVRNACSSLVSVDPAGRLMLSHYTVRQYLLSKPSDPSLSCFHFDLQTAQRDVGNVCMAYLCFKDFENKNQPLGNGWLGTKRPDIIESNTNSRSSVSTTLESIENTIYGFIYDDRSSTETQCKRTIPSTSGNGKSRSQKYALLPYVIENWNWHTTQLLYEESRQHQKQRLERLALEYISPLKFHFRPWVDKYTSLNPEYPYRQLFLWAARAGHVGYLSLLKNPRTGVDLRGYLLQCKGTYSRVGLDIVRRVNVLRYLIKYGLPEDLIRWLLDIAVNYKIPKAVNLLLYPEQLLKTKRQSTWSIKSATFSVKLTSAPSLLTAVEWGHIEALRLLLRCGGNPNVQNDAGRTALHLAVALQNIEILNVLFEHNADPNIRDAEGYTPLMIALGTIDDISTLEHIVIMLLRNKADPNIQNYQHRAPLHLSTCLAPSIMNSLLLNQENPDLPANPNVKDLEGSTPLYSASSYEAAFQLLEHGANVHTTNRLGQTPLFFAASTAIANLLLEWSADPNASDYKGRTPLSYHDKNPETVRLLLEHGAEPPAREVPPPPTRLNHTPNAMKMNEHMPVPATAVFDGPMVPGFTHWEPKPFQRAGTA
ncbi:hypothetical protein EDC01DRAFT_634495 [Geopyxis carbonaria]|nr:hypothetical protein EDC01DRAFT_634495 [Geopyxis carbonaria]